MSEAPEKAAEAETPKKKGKGGGEDEAHGDRVRSDGRS